MSVKNTVNAILKTSFDSGDFDGTWQAINPTGLPEACFLVRVINISKGDVSLSYDGLIEHDVIPADETLQLPLEQNKAPSNNVALLPKGTVIYLRGAQSVGYIHLVGYYQF